MKKILSILAIILGVTSCEMDFYRSDTMTSSQLKDNPGSAVYTTDGNYSMFKDIPVYNGGQMGGNSYDRHFYTMTEFRGDNACLSGRTTSPVFQSMTYTDDPYIYSVTGFWYISYRIIYGCNANISSLQEGVSVETDHILGENYFLRALCHMNLIMAYSTPYTRGADKPSIVLRTSTDCSVTQRATVREVYEQAVQDLLKASELMKAGKRRGDAGFVGYESARALLVRAYLHMEKNEEAIALASDMLGNDPASHLDPDVENYFANARTSKETLWCIAKVATDEKYSPKAQIGSLFYSNDVIGGTGWCQIYYSDPLIELFNRYPQDRRFSGYCHMYDLVEGQKMIHWPIPDKDNSFRSNIVIHNAIEQNDGSYSFVYEGKNYVAKKKMVNTYPVYYVENLMTDSEDLDGFENGTRVYVRPDVEGTGVRNSYPAYAMSKFSWQDGEPMLSSPVMLRWAEVILNRAEAYAKCGENEKALADVNLIRRRAGLPVDADMTLSNYHDRGYSSVLDVVLDERRMELCFEGFRAFDLFRNSKSIDRRFPGMQNWEIITPEQLDKIYPHYFPYDETSVSGISQSK